MAVVFLRWSLRDLYWRAPRTSTRRSQHIGVGWQENGPNGDRRSAVELFMTPRLSQMLTLATDVCQFN